MLFFSTLCVPASERLAAWRHAVEDSCGALDTEPGRPEFEGSLDSRSTKDFGMVRVSHTAREAHRGHRDIQSSGAERVFFALQIAGKLEIKQSGRCLQLSPGDMTVVDGAAPFSSRFDRKNIQLLLHIPRAAMAPLDGNWEDRILRPFSPKFRNLLGCLVQSTFDHIGDGEAVDDIAYQCIVPLIRGALAPDERQGTAIAAERQDRTARMTLLIRQYIGSRIAEEGLTPATIANALNMSERQLHRVVSHGGQSVGSLIRLTRLERCATDLRNPANKERSITDIAFSWGFNDAAHFSRQFRAEYEQTPTEYRMTSLLTH